MGKQMILRDEYVSAAAKLHNLTTAAKSSKKLEDSDLNMVGHLLID